jgi:hypothetical protein
VGWVDTWRTLVSILECVLLTLRTFIVTEISAFSVLQPYTG